MEILETFELTANQAVVFVKTFNSWPITGNGSEALRRTFIINIETEA
jgi:hypothetical protein